MTAKVSFRRPIAIERIALPLRSHIIRAVIPVDVGGAYCIYRGRAPIYAGRSTRIRARLLSHAAVELGTHFTWQPAADDRAAFILESFWFHRLVDAGQAENLIHPARPMIHSTVSCPICNEAHRGSIQAALRKLIHGL